jgi:uncharacterized protein YjiK
MLPLSLKCRPILFATGIALCVAALAQHAGVLHRFSLEADAMNQWRLPDRLNEISGLALTPDGRLLAVNDEVAIVYELDYDDGRIVKAFAFGKPVVKGDFEGIAVVDDLVYLTTSKGRVYFAAEGADGQRVSFDNYDTELGQDCEIEGLTRSTDNARLYFLCKNVRKKSALEGLTLFAWDIARRELLADESVVLPERQIMQQLRVDRLNPTGITIDRQSGNRIMVASRQKALIELTEDGELVSARNMPLTNRHRQAEGIELTSDGRLLIADEGGTHKARLAVYFQSVSDGNNDD